MNASVQKTGLRRVTHGRGLPVLVLHGGLGWDHTYLRPGLDLLRNNVQRIYYGHRGAGYSAEPTGVAGAQVVVSEASGPFPFLEAPERFVAAVEQWLAPLAAGSGAGG